MSKLVVRKPENLKRFRDQTGKQYGDWRVLRHVGFIGPYSAWEIECKCGKRKVVRQNHLAGLGLCRHLAPTQHPLYQRWLSTRDLMCDLWRDDFWAFAKEVESLPSHRTDVIDAPDSSKPIGPGNWGWFGCAVRQRNRVRHVTHRGVTLPASRWADLVGITRERMRQRVNSFGDEGALSCYSVDMQAARKCRDAIYGSEEMARKCAENEIAFTDRGRPSSYPWDEWFDGNTWELTPGKDFTTEVKAFQSTAQQAARNRRLRLRTRSLGDKVYIRAEGKR